MQKLRALWIGSMLLPACLKAGLIYGSVIKQGKAVPNTHIKIQCPGGSAEGDTAGDGSYRIQVSAEGRCTLSLPSYSKPAQYDLELVPSQRGSYDLRIR